MQKDKGKRQKPRKLTPKQRKLFRGVADGMNQKDAAIAAGYAPKSAKVTASRLLNDERLQLSLQKEMERAGLNNEALLVKHRELLSATKQIPVSPGTDESSMVFIDVPDWNARAKGLDMAYRLRGEYSDEKHEVTVETHEQRLRRLMGNQSIRRDEA